MQAPDEERSLIGPQRKRIAPALQAARSAVHSNQEGNDSLGCETNFSSLTASVCLEFSIRLHLGFASRRQTCFDRSVRRLSGAPFSADSPLHARLAAVQCDFCNDKTILIFLRRPRAHGFSGTCQQRSATSGADGLCGRRHLEGFLPPPSSRTSRPLESSLLPSSPPVPGRMWPGAIQSRFNLDLQFSKSSQMLPQAVGKELAGFLRCLQGKLLAYLHPNSLIRLTKAAGLPPSSPAPWC